MFQVLRSFDQPHQVVRRPNAIVADGVKYLGDSVRLVGRLLVILKASNAASNFAMMSVEDVIVGVSYWLQRASGGSRLGC